jgi:hypothetical protein
MPDTDLDLIPSDVVNDTSPELGGDLDVGAFVLKSTTNDMVFDVSAVAGGDFIFKPDTTGKMIIREEGGTPGTDEMQWYSNGGTMTFKNAKTNYGIDFNSNGTGGGSLINFQINGSAKLAISNNTINPDVTLKPTASSVDLGVIGTNLFRDIFLKPSSSLTPLTNGELNIEATSNTQLTFKYKGSDGTVRTNTLTLS